MSESQVVKSLPVYSLISGAAAVVAIGEVLISKKFNKTKNQEKMERAIVIPMECVKAPEVCEEFRPLVESALMESARNVLAAYCLESTIATEVKPELFSRVALTEAFLSRNDQWLTSEQCEAMFLESATWKKFAARADFATPVIFKQATQYKELIIKCAAKTAHYPAATRDAILAKMEEADMETDLGAFVAKRFAQMAKKDVVELLDLGAL